MPNDPDQPMRGMEAVLHAIFEPQLDSMMSDFAEADCYAVVTLDPETGYCGYIGPFESLDEANAYRSLVEDDLNRAMPRDETPFRATVVPMLNPEPSRG